VRRPAWTTRIDQPGTSSHRGAQNEHERYAAESGVTRTRRRPLRGAGAGVSARPQPWRGPAERAPTSTPQAATDQSGTSGQAAGVACWRLPWRSSIQLAGGGSRALATLARLACDRLRRRWTCCPLARGGRLRGKGAGAGTCSRGHPARAQVTDQVTWTAL
jgi:hypothetical protein